MPVKETRGKIRNKLKDERMRSSENPYLVSRNTVFTVLRLVEGPVEVLHKYRRTKGVQDGRN